MDQSAGPAISKAIVERSLPQFRKGSPTTRNRRWYALLFAFLACAGGYWFLHPLSFAEAFGFSAPGSAAEVNYRYERVGKARIIQAWARIEVGKDRADSVCSGAGLQKETFSGLYLPPSVVVPEWWDDTWGDGVREHWRLAYPNMKPAIAYAFWKEGKLYVYKFGSAGPNEPPKMERSRWDNWKHAIGSRMHSLRARLLKTTESSPAASGPRERTWAPRQQTYAQVA